MKTEAILRRKAVQRWGAAAKRVLQRLVLAAVILAAGIASGAPVGPAQATPEQFGVILLPDSRGGTVVAETVARTLRQMGLSWWYSFDYGAAADLVPGMNRVVMIQANPPGQLSEADLRARIGGRTGLTFLIGNEPNVSGQDDVTPDRYAEVLRHYATTIKLIDPTAKIVGPNMLNWEATCSGCGGGFPSGRDWTLDLVAKYQAKYGEFPPFDAWGIHAYNVTWDQLPMTNTLPNKTQIEDLRTYLSGTPAAGKPIWLTEFGVIWAFDKIPCNGCDNGAFHAFEAESYLRDMTSWLNANSSALNIERWFFYANKGYPEPFAAIYGGLSMMDGVTCGANLTAFGAIYRDAAGAPAAAVEAGGCPSTPPGPPPPSSGGGGGGGGGGNTTTPPAPAEPPASGPPSGSASGSVTVGAGGTVETTTVAVTVPAGVVNTRGPGDAPLSIAVTAMDAPAGGPASSVPGSNLPSGTPPPSGSILMGTNLFTIVLRDSAGNEVHQLDRPLQLVVKYTDADLALVGGDPSALHLRRYDEATKTWVDLGGTVDPVNRTITASTDHLSLFGMAARLRAPQVGAPAAGSTVQGLGPTLVWTQMGGTAQYHIQIVPFNDDGPGINLIIGAADMVAASRYQVLPPVLGQGNYVMLPSMTYTWRVRTTPVTVSLGVNDPGWSDWSTGSFRTPPVTSATITPVAPGVNFTVDSLTPTVRWSDLNSNVFYYEVQMSKDQDFVVDPAMATAAVYWNLVHAGETDPQSSWMVPASAALEPATTYHWRVRPRIQGDGNEVAWSDTWSFRTP